jgi:hypothetical protein
MISKPTVQDLAEWAKKVRFEDLPESKVKILELSIGDGLGCGL